MIAANAPLVPDEILIQCNKLALNRPSHIHRTNKAWKYSVCVQYIFSGVAILDYILISSSSVWGPGYRPLLKLDVKWLIQLLPQRYVVIARSVWSAPPLACRHYYHLRSSKSLHFDILIRRSERTGALNQPTYLKRL